MILTTKKLEKLRTLYEAGDNKYTKYFYKRVIGDRKDNLKFQLTHEELEEYAKCANSIEYFIETYIDIKLRDYQIEALKHFQENRFQIFAVSRQSGMTSVFVLAILHYMLFNSNKNILVYDIKNAMIQERSEKFMYYYRQVPFFLQKGLNINNIKSKKFDNDSRLIFRNSTNIGIGFKVDVCIFFDFPSYTTNNTNKIFNELLPTLTSIMSTKIIIEGRPNGYNLFYKLLENSERPEGDPSKNAYKTFRAYWWQVPGRDEEWKQKQILAIGSQEDFDREYDLKIRI